MASHGGALGLLLLALTSFLLHTCHGSAASPGQDNLFSAHGQLVGRVGKLQGQLQEAQLRLGADQWQKIPAGLDGQVIGAGPEADPVPTTTAPLRSGIGQFWRGLARRWGWWGRPRQELTLEQAVKNACGTDRRVIIGIVSSTYLDFAENWWTSLNRLGFGGKVVFIALDQQAYDYLSERHPDNTVKAPHDDLGNQTLAGADSKIAQFDYGSAYFRRVVDRKPEFMLRILNMNISVLYNDLDIVWRGNPFPYLGGEVFDVIFQQDARLFQSSRHWTEEGDPLPQPFQVEDLKFFAVCTCFMFIRASDGGRKLITLWKESIERSSNSTGEPVHDQPEMNKVLREAAPGGFRVGVLPLERFPSGCLYFDSGERCERGRAGFQKAGGLEKVVVVHNNWISGYVWKLKRFKDANLWFIENALRKGV